MTWRRRTLLFGNELSATYLDGYLGEMKPRRGTETGAARQRFTPLHR
jgi:hypothetical protein